MSQVKRVLMNDETGTPVVPWVPAASTTTPGVVKVDGTTVQVNDGVLSTVANASDKVSKSGDTMTGNLIVSTANSGTIQIKSTNGEIGTVPTAAIYGSLSFADKNNVVLGYLQNYIQTNDARATVLSCRNKANSASAALNVGFNASGTAFASAPTPLAASNNTDIATTAWVRAMLVNITALSATSGTVSLADNTIYSMSITGATTFSLPTPSDTTKFHQIKVIAAVTGTPTITWGTTKFFNKATPSIEAGSYDFYFDYDPKLSAWVAGAVAKGA